MVSRRHINEFPIIAGKWPDAAVGGVDVADMSPREGD
jgi:hypothetical protein